MDPDEISYEDPRNARVRIIQRPAPARALYPVAQPRVYPPAYAPTAYPPATYSPAMYPPAFAPGGVIVERPRRILDMPAGDVLALAAQAFAALQPLPAAPVPVGLAETDVPNMITYQSALATHAKRDEQLRTIGALVAKLLA